MPTDFAAPRGKRGLIIGVLSFPALSQKAFIFGVHAITKSGFPTLVQPAPKDYGLYSE